MDCGGRTANESLAYWKKHLLPFNNRTDLDRPHLPAKVTRHSAHPEFFLFVLDNVLFLGQGLPTPRDENMPDQEEWNTYLEANANWTKEHFSANANTIRAAVIFSHSSAGPVQPYFDELKEIATMYKDIPILFLEDNHWIETKRYPQAPNLYRLKLDDTVTPVSITIDTNEKLDENDVTNDIFQYSRRCWCSDGHNPTMLVEYSSGECQGVCDTNDFCADEDGCGKASCV